MQYQRIDSFSLQIGNVERNDLVGFKQRHIQIVEANPLTADRSHRRQQLGHRSWFGPHDITTLRGVEFVGGVGLPPFELLRSQRPVKATHVFDEVPLKGDDVKGMAGRHVAGAGEGVFSAHVDGGWG